MNEEQERKRKHEEALRKSREAKQQRKQAEAARRAKIEAEPPWLSHRAVPLQRAVHGSPAECWNG